MKREVVKAIGIFLAAAGLTGVIVQFLTTPGILGTASLLLLFAFLVLLGLWLFFYSIWRARKVSRALPPVEQLEDICTGYHITEATLTDIDWIANLEAEVYPPADAVPKHILLEWYNTNPTGFSIIRMTTGQRIGHIDLLPLRPATLRTFLEGNIVEKDIRGDSLYSPSERDLIQDLYVESIIVLPPKGLSNAPPVLCVLTNFPTLVDRICNPSSLANVYAIAASKSGERLLRRLGFDPITSAEARADHHDFFAARSEDLAKNVSTICGTRFPEDPSGEL